MLAGTVHGAMPCWAATGTCSYTASPAGRTATLNTATGTFNGIDFIATADVSFVRTIVDGTAEVDDDQNPGFPTTVNAGEGPWSWDYPESVTCATNRSAYGEDGVYGDSEYNLATVTASDGDYDQDDATTTWECVAGFVDVIKTFDGVPDPSKDVTFALYGPTGDYLGESLSTFGVADGTLAFQTALVPGTDYTICESPVPAGWVMEVISATPFIGPFSGPPGVGNPTGDVQCWTFTAAAEATAVFEVDNSSPGGGPRTPGYWRNWSTCTNGNQAETAANLGGPAAGVYLLDDLLPQEVGILTVDDCETGVSVLSAEDVMTGKVKSNDALFKLARDYLAALLNQGAGACTPAGLGDVMDDAQALLEAYGFDGSGGYLSPRKVRKHSDKRADRQLALQLAWYLDDYNNGDLCTGIPSH